MPTVNPGPAITSNPNSIAELVPVNTQVSSGFPIGANALRLIACGRAVPLSGTGDVLLMGVQNASSWAPVSVAFTNGLVNGVSATIAAVNLGLFTGAAATGTTIRTAGVLTGQTSSTVFTTAAAATTAVTQSAQGVYVNVTAALAGATCDIFVYGYDVS